MNVSWDLYTPRVDAVYASFMKNILGAINPADLHTLLEDVRVKALDSTSGLGNESTGKGFIYSVIFG